MKLQLFIKSGQAAYGNTWQSDLSEDLDMPEDVIEGWIKDDAVKASNGTMVSILESRKCQIDNTISELYADKVIENQPNWDAELTVVSDNGDMLDEVFDNLKQARAWVNLNWGEEDAHFFKYHQITVAEHAAINIIQHYSDIYDPASVLRLIEDVELYSKNQTKQDVFIELAQLNDTHWGREYYKYYLENVFGLMVKLIFDIEQNTDDRVTPLSYAEYIKRQLKCSHDFLVTLS